MSLNAPPVPVCNNLTVAVGSNCTAMVTAEQIGQGSYDPNGDNITYSISPSGPFGVGSHTITLTVQDPYGLNSSCQSTLLVIDNQAPTVILKDAVINLSSDGGTTLTLAHINNGITDNCNLSSIEISKTQFGCDNMGKNLVSVTVKDAAGNQTTKWCTVTVLDVTPPQVFAKNAVIFLNFDGYASLDPKDIDYGTFDKCSMHKLSLSKSVFSCENVGFNVVDLIATDASGNVSKTSVIVKVVDNILPYQSDKKLEVELNKGEELVLDKNTPGLNIYDVCGLKSIEIISEKITCETKSKSVNVRATDKNDNILVTDISLIVKDTKFPIVKTKPTKLFLEANGKATLKANMVDDGSTDNCKIDTMYVSKNVFSCENIGKDSITFFVKDTYGNISSKKEQVTIIDSLPPVIKAKNISKKLDASGKAKIVVADIEDGSVDNCKIKSQTLSKDTFDCSSIGANKIQYVVEDVNGNKATQEITITIIDEIAPTIKAKENITLGLDNSGSLKITIEDLLSELSDNCAIKEKTLSKQSFDCSNIGKNTVVVTVKDAAGNSTSANVSFNLIDAFGNCLCSYAMLASESINIDGTNISYGGLGTYSPGKTITLKSASFGDVNTFVKSDNLTADVSPKNIIKGVAPAPLAFEENTFSDKKRLNVKKGKSESSSESHFGRVKIGKNATLTINGSGDLYIKNLKIKGGGSLNFANETKVHIKDYIRLGDEIVLNQTEQKVKFFLANNLSINKSSTINAGMHSLKNINIKDGDASKKTQIKGLLAAQNISSGKNVVLFGAPTDCNNVNKASGEKQDTLLAQSNAAENIIEENTSIEKRYGFGPNPTDDLFSVVFYETDLKILTVKTINAQGKEFHVSYEKNGNNRIALDISRLAPGAYFVKINTNKNIELIKMIVR